jgi:hypothetical protein
MYLGVSVHICCNSLIFLQLSLVKIASFQKQWIYTWCKRVLTVAKWIFENILKCNFIYIYIYIHHCKKTRRCSSTFCNRRSQSIMDAGLLIAGPAPAQAVSTTRFIHVINTLLRCASLKSLFLVTTKGLNQRLHQVNIYNMMYWPQAMLGYNTSAVIWTSLNRIIVHLMQGIILQRSNNCQYPQYAMETEHKGNSAYWTRLEIYIIGS